MTLTGKTALVTGGSRGIGRGIALKLAEGGAKVAVHYFQKEDQAKATLEKLRALGSDGFVVQADVCQPEEIRRVYNQTTIINNYTGQPRHLESVALAVLVNPQTAHDDLYQQLQGKVTQLYRVGDCVAPRRVEHAILNGERAARTLHFP